MDAKLETLLEQVNQTYPGTVMTRVSGPADGRLRLDRVQQSVLADRLLIEVQGQTEANFVLGNELLKLLLTLNGIVPQIFFALTFEKEALDQQLIQLATRMHRVVVHAISYRELARQGFLTAETAAAFVAGVQDELSKEGDQVDGESLFRLLTMLDAAVFLKAFEETGARAQAADYSADFAADYPWAFAAAKKLTVPILAADLTASRQIHRQIVQLFAAVDETLSTAALPTINANQYVTLAPVLSKRQLGATVASQYEIFHSDMIDFKTGEKAFVGLGKQDRQNTFVITAPSNPADRPAFFKELYAWSVEDLLTKLALPYIPRD
ncbi:nitrate ABC transporter ATPase [Leuconostocaceae bacterium ESL0958]|nr:nitrate ABC transporter ATPase [Leuconostocaceae bacterium ESL0958]